MKTSKKKYKTVSSHISVEIERKLEEKARKNKRSLSYTIGEILEAYVMPKAEKKGKKGA